MITAACIDFHTHHPSREGETVILDGRDTWGIHPWTLHHPTRQPSASDLAIGECGLDRLCATPYEAQKQAFRQCIAESERLHKPLFLHCVKTIDDCLHLRRELNATQPWVWHGFRGKPQQVSQLITQGMFFSFGFHYNMEALLACPADRLLLETDNDPRPVRLLYEQVAALRNLSFPQLCQQMTSNYQRLFEV